MSTASEGRSVTDTLSNVAVAFFFLPLFAVLPLYERVRGGDDARIRARRAVRTPLVADHSAVLAVESTSVFAAVVGVVAVASPTLGVPDAVGTVLATWVGGVVVLWAADAMDAGTGGRSAAAFGCSLLLGGGYTGGLIAAELAAGPGAATVRGLLVVVAGLYGGTVANGYLIKAGKVRRVGGGGDPTRTGASEDTGSSMVTEIPEERGREIVDTFAEKHPDVPDNLAGAATVTDARKVNVFRDVVTTLHVEERRREHTVPKPEFEDERSTYRSDPERRHDLDPDYDDRTSYKYLFEESLNERYCPNCDGGGKADCPQCRGTGEDPDPRESGRCDHCDGHGTIGCTTCDTTGRLVDFVTLERTYTPDVGVSFRNKGVPTEVLTDTEGERVEQRVREPNEDGIHGRRTEVHEITVEVVTYEYAGEEWTLYSVEGTTKALRYPTRFRRQFRYVQATGIALIAAYLALAASAPAFGA